MATYKEQHELFISGHNGTSVTEVAILTFTPCACLLARDVLLLAYGLYRLPFWSRVIFDFSIIIVPAILTSTVFSHLTAAVGITLFICAGISFALTVLSVSYGNIHTTLGKISSLELEPHRPFIDCTRALMNVGTAVVILGVDFVAFPRRFAKTETFGTGYMDIGVGCFVISNALVSPEARGKYRQCQSARDFLLRLLQSLKSSFPLLVFGVGRLLAVKSTDYHEHVSEYGVHWNFFFTLVVVKVISTAFLGLCPVYLSTAVSALVMSAYQYALSRGGLTQYILYGSDGAGSRHGVLDANREGLFSSMGYVSLYLAGVQIGSLLFSTRKQNFRDWVKLCVILLLLSCLSYYLQSLSSSLIQPTSRRLANITFVFWILGLSLQVLWSCLAVDLLSTMATVLVFTDRKKMDIPNSEKQILSHPYLHSAVPCVLHAVNKNGLFYFLLANVLTGLVNLAIPTMHMSAAVAVVTLLTYMFTLSVVIVYIDLKNIKTKFW